RKLAPDETIGLELTVDLELSTTLQVKSDLSYRASTGYELARMHEKKARTRRANTPTSRYAQKNLASSLQLPLQRAQSRLPKVPRTTMPAEPEKVPSASTADNLSKRKPLPIAIRNLLMVAVGLIVF